MLSPKSTNFRAIQFFMATAFFVISVLNVNAQSRNTNPQQVASCVQGTVSASPSTICVGSSTTLTATPATLSNCFSASLITAGNVNYQYSSTFVDNNQNVYFSGAYTGSINVVGQTLPAIGNRDFFMAKYSACGAESWAIYGSSSKNDQLGNDGGKAIAVDNDGNTYIVGRYNANSIIYSTGGSRFVPQSYVSNAGFPNAQDGFLIKVNASGVIQWGVTIYGGSNDGFNGVTIDGAGNPIVTAVYNANPITGGVTINDINGSSFIGAGNITGSTAALIKFSPLGDLQWITKVFNKDAVASSVTTNGTDIYFTGWYNAATSGADVQVTDASGASNSFTNNGIGNAFIIKLSENGNWQWGNSFGNGGVSGNTQTYINDVTIDGAGNPWIAGYYSGSRFTVGTTEMPDATSTEYAFLVKYDAAGNAVLVKSYQQTSTDTRFYGVAVNGNSIATCGNYRGDAGGLNDVLLVTFDNNGNVLHDVTGGSSGDDIAYCVRPFRYGFMISGANGAGATIPAGGVIATTEGSFLWNTTGGAITSSVSWTDISGNSITGNPITVTPSSSTTYYCTFDDGYTTCTQSIDVVVNHPVSTVTNYTICSGETYLDPGSNNTYSVAGSYEIILTGSNGCDSISTVNIRVLPLSYSTTNVTICSNLLPYSWNTISCPTQGTYTDTLIAANGCDSIVTLNLTVNPTTSSNETVTACINYNWNLNNYTTTGTYTFITSNAYGCDSVVTLNLTITPQPEQPTIACYETATFNTTTCSWDVTGTQPEAPTGLACYETATFNTTTCSWDVTGTQPEAPTGLACYETATFNTTTCSWDVTGTQPEAPTGLACYETATFNTTTCSWDITGTQPEAPTGLACYETATFNTATCSWDVTGTQPEAPTGLACYETATFNTTTCSWEVTGTQPEAPTGLACYETATFNTTTCSWDVTGTQPEAPTGLACYETATFNTTTCSWDVTGTQPEAPTGLACYETATFNTTTCSWDVTGTQPEAPTGLACYETATFNTATCSWDVTGTQPEAPTGLACYETATFNTTTCSWEVTGTQPEAPTGLACYETATFNTTTCSWDVTGTQPEAPTGLACYETATFNTTTCSWDVTGTQPEAPTGLACYETATFNTTTCSWDVTGTQPEAPTGLACYETATFNTTTCSWDVTGTQPEAPTGLACYETATFNTTTCSWDVTGTQPEAPTGLACYETATFNTTTCSWDVTGTQPEQPTIACYETATFNTTTCSWDVTGTQPEAPTGLACYETATFNTTTCSWDVTGTQPEAPTGLACYETAIFNTTTCSWDVTGTQPEAPTGLACYETATFNTTTCSWDITGTQPEAPTGLACYETATFNTTTCSWDVTGTQPEAPTGLACYETATFNTTTCSWDVTGTHPEAPTGLACYETATFNTTTCSWDVTGTQPEAPTGLACYETATFNTTTCSWDVTGTQPEAPTGLACYETATFNTTTCSWDVTGTQPLGIVYDTACSNQLPYLWNSLLLRVSGVYSVFLVSSNGCDSIARLYLTVANTTSSTTNVTVCSNNLPYQWNGNDYNASGTYNVTLTNAAGCDSVATLNLTVGSTSSSTTELSICSNLLPFQWNGITYGANGTYTFTTTGNNGCDSLSILILTINPIPDAPQVSVTQPTCTITTGTITVTSPLGADYTYYLDANPGGPEFTNVSTGVHTVTVSQNGCTSLPTSVTINPSSAVPATPVITGPTNICQYIGTNDQVCYTISNYDAAYQYTITLPNGAALSSPINPNGVFCVTFLNTQIANGQILIRVVATNDCGNSPVGLIGLVRRIPSTPGIIRPSSSNICESIVNSTPITYCINPVSGATSYCWSVPAGASILPSGATDTCIVGNSGTCISVVYNSSFAGGRINVYAANPCGNSNPRSRIIQAINIAAPITLNVVQPTCTVATATITVTAPVGNGYQYSLDGNFNTPRRNNIFTGVTPGLHTITVSNNGTCFVNSDTTIVINQQATLPTVDTILGPDNICPYIGTGDTIRYTALIGNANGNVQYHWTRIPVPGIDSIAGGGLNDDYYVVRFITPLSTPQDRLTLYVSNECGNTETYKKYFSAQAPTTPRFITPSSTDVCSAIASGSSIYYCVNPVVAATGYSWTLPPGVTAIGRTDSNCIELQFSSSFSDGRICVSSFNNCGTSVNERCYDIIRNLAGVNSVISGPTLVCDYIAPNGTAATYSVNNTPGLIYNWTYVSNCQGTITIPGSTNSISYLFPSTFCGGSIQVTATNGCGTSNPKILPVRASRVAPTPVITTVQPNCQLSTGSVTITSPLGAGYTYTLTSSGQPDVVSTTPSFDGLLPGDYQVYAINNDLCSAASFTAFTLNDVNLSLPVTISTSGPTTFCDGGSVTLDASTGYSGDTYLWTPGGSTNSSITVTTSGTYTVTVTTPVGCVGSDAVVVTVNPLPAVVITPSGPTTFCEGGSVDLIASGGVNFEWSDGINIIGNSSTLTVSTTGLYTVTVTNAEGCTSTSSINVTVNALPVAIITANGSTTFCEGGSVELTATGGTSYEWSNGSTIVGTTSTITVTTGGTYTVTVTNDDGCSSTTSIVVTVNPLPAQATITIYGANPICDGSTDRLVASPSGPGYTYLWSPTFETTQEIYVDATGTFHVTVFNEFGCSTVSSDTTIIVNPLPVPVVTSSGSFTICDGNPITLTASGGTPNSNYVWNTIPRTRNSYGTTLVVSTPGSYVITITNNPTGCNGSDTVVVINGTATTSTENATACNSYNWNGNDYTSSGVYTFHTTNSTGCDSTAILNLTINTSTSSTETITACNSYNWNGNDYTSSGTYTFNAINANGCDSVATLILTINTSTSGFETVTACNSFSWNGNDYTSSGTYTFNTQNANGCDSVATLNLTINTSTSSTESITACNSYNWNGNDYTSSGTYTFNAINANGCDSVATLNLTINTSTSSTETVTACNTYNWNGIDYTSSGTYTFNTQNANGCDSVATLNLTINTSTSSTETVTACNSYNWNGNDYTSSGTYTFNTQNANGCDSVATLNLTINTSTSSTETVTACNTYNWNGIDYTSSGTYTFNTQNANGCDSVATLNLTINTSTSSTESITACNSFNWNGNDYTSSGTYTFNAINANGCDSVATLNLTINTSTSSTETVTACNSYSWNGNDYTSSGTYTFNTQNANGCDSVATLNLTINTSTSSTETVTACNTYNWNGIDYTSSGTYTFNTQNANGCDSVATLNLTINTSTSSTESITACNSYNWNGIDYTSSGTYTFNTQNANGCDSVATLNLTINTSTSSTETVTACNSYNWNGNDYTSSGTYTFNTLNANGCDSVATLNLTINTSTSSTESITACNSYSWNGNDYTSSGTYTFNTQNANGCDSVATLNLTINTSTSSTESITACNSFNWNGNDYTSSGTYTFNAINANGCDSVATLNLTINTSTSSTETVTACNSYSWNGNDYTSSGTYTFNTTNENGCDSVATLNLTINTSTSSTEDVAACITYNWNGNDYTSSGTYTFNTLNANGCDSVATLNLIINTSTTSTTDVIVCANQLPYTWNTVGYDVEGTYTYIVTNAAGCDSIATLNLVVTQAPTIEGVSGPANICSFVGTGDVITYSVINPIPGTRYIWFVSQGVNLLTDTSTGPSSVQLEFTPSLINGNAVIRVYAIDDCNQNSETFSYYLVSRQLTTPSWSVSPIVEVCPSITDQTTVTYTINPVLGADSYYWNFVNSDGITSVTGVTIISPAGVSSFAELQNVVDLTSITVLFDSSFAGGILNIAGINGCGLGNVRSLPINKEQKTVRFDSPSITNVCNYVGTSENIYYRAQLYNGTGTFIWTLPDNVTLNGGGLVSISSSYSSVSLNFESGFTGGNLQVVVLYNCGTTSAILPLTASAPETPTAINGPTSVCDNVVSTGNTASYMVDGAYDATSYTWVIPDGCIINGQSVTSLTTNENSVQVLFPDGFFGGPITVIANNSCGSSAPISLDINACLTGKSKIITSNQGLENINLKVFPNPTTSEFKLNVNTTGKEQIAVRILDNYGRVIKTMKMMPYETIRFGNELMTGAYLLEVLQGNKKMTQRIIKF